MVEAAETNRADTSAPKNSCGTHRCIITARSPGHPPYLKLREAVYWLVFGLLPAWFGPIQEMQMKNISALHHVSVGGAFQPIVETNSLNVL